MRSLRLLLAFCSVLSFASFSSADAYKVDTAHSSVGFEIRHMFTKVKGAFNEFDGQFNFDPKAIDKSDVTFTIQAKSIDTKNGKRDDHLRGPDFFEVSKHPTITFKSKKITNVKGKKFKIVGDMSMHGVTKEVTFDAEYLGGGKDPFGRDIESFTATSKINRQDFGMKWNKALDKGGVLLGDDITMDVQVEGEKIKAEAKKN